MKKNKIPGRSAAGRRQVLMLVPAIPSPQASLSQKAGYDALTLASARHEVLCLPEDKPLSARLDEAALAARGISVYSFPPVTRADVSSRLKTLLTANPGLELVGFVGLETMRRHLVDARLFAPSKSFFAVLDGDDAALLGSTSFSEDDRNLLSCCDAIFCASGADAEFLRRFFCVNACKLSSISSVLSGLGRGPRREAEKLGIISPAPLRPALDLRGAFKAGGKKRASGNAPYFSEMNCLVLGARADVPAWGAVSRPFPACEALWFRLKTAFQTFPNAGLVLPSQAVLKGPAAFPAAGIVLEAASLNRQGMHSEPLVVDDLPLIILRSEAFRKVGGFDTRFSSPSCAWTDLGLRMRQAGFRVITAEDAVVCSRPPATVPAGPNTDLLVHKWCAEGLRIMELLVFELGGRQP